MPTQAVVGFQPLCVLRRMPSFVVEPMQLGDAPLPHLRPACEVLTSRDGRSSADAVAIQHAGVHHNPVHHAFVSSQTTKCGIAAEDTEVRA